MWMDEWVLNAPEEALRGRVLFRFFETRRRVVVLSSSNKPEIETNTTACEADGIPILRRKGGGGTVVLGPGCVVLTLAFRARELFNNAAYFRQVNALWIEALGTLGGFDATELATRGISDIAAGDKKIAGTSVFRRKHLFVYQGSLLVDPNFDAVSRYLAHPSKEPDYRAGRDHRSFLTSLRELGCPLSASDVASACNAHFRARAASHFEDALLPHSE
jgi:lipoate-protein ligase A